MKYNLNSDYNFEETEIIAPEKLVSDICSELTEITRGYVQGNIGEYDGEIFSFDKLSLLQLLLILQQLQELTYKIN